MNVYQRCQQDRRKKRKILKLNFFHQKGVDCTDGEPDWQGGGEGFQGYRKSRNRLPETLRSYATRSWVSPGGTTLYNEVSPVTMELEKKIVTGLMKDLNGLFDLGLGTDPILARTLGGDKQNAKPAILVISGSNAGRTADEFEERGYTVTRICSPGWKPTTQSVQAILPKE
jgi:hypothetical protein